MARAWPYTHRPVPAPGLLVGCGRREGMEAQDVARFGPVDSRRPLLATGACRPLSHRSIAHRCPERVDAGRLSHRTTSDACGIAFQTQPLAGRNALGALAASVGARRS